MKENIKGALLVNATCIKCYVALLLVTFLIKDFYAPRLSDLPHLPIGIGR